MMVANHFDVRWVDGYSAVSDVPSSLAATIEKLAAELPSSGDRIELAVRDIRKPDGMLAWVGLLRFVVAVSSVPRPLGFLHAAVLPGGYRIDIEGWRSLVSRRYGPFPEERIRTLYEELAESTKDSGRDRLHALAIRPEDIRELLVPLDDVAPIPGLPRAHARPGSRPRVGPYPRPASAPGIVPPPAAAPRRPSAPVLPLSLRVINLPEPPPDSSGAEERRLDHDLPNDITQPMTAPSGTAGPISSEHPQHRLIEERGQRAWWVVGAVIGTLAVLLGAVVWLAHRHVALVEERDRLREELKRRTPDLDAWEHMRADLEVVKRELEERKKADQSCQVRIEEATKRCTEALGLARSEARTNGDNAAKFREEAQARVNDLTAAKNELAAANSKYERLKNDLNTATSSKDGAEQLYREEQRRTSDLVTAREVDAKKYRASLLQRDEQLRALCKRLQSPAGGDKPPKECQGIK